MDLPKPPADQELKNIIDKLAQFVARNGPEFEQMTKAKQKDNPKFSFLFGGELFNYYQYKVTTEQAILKVKGAREDSSHGDGQKAGFQMQILSPSPANNLPWMANPPAPTPGNKIPVSTIIEQQNVLQMQIEQSEQNLAAQHAALMQAQEAAISTAIKQAQVDSLHQQAEKYEVRLAELQHILQPIIETCTKDSISSGKAWILNHSNQESHEIIAEYLLYQVIHSSKFTQKLHVVYLLNDVIHHCVRKNATHMKRALETVVVPMFCNAWIGTSEDQQAKLTKLLNLWETKNTYFNKEILTKLKTPESSWSEYLEDISKTYEHVTNPIKISTQQQYENFLTQHQTFVGHAMSQIQTLEEQKKQLEAEELLSTQQSFDAPPPNMDMFTQPPPSALFPHLPPEVMPDFSKPPPGFPTVDLYDELIPTVPYYDLPAGLMVPLVKIDDFNYKALDPGKLRLPPAIPPSERLIQALEAFYQKGNTNTRERLILDADGWEKLGLYEYFKAKNQARKQKEMDVEAGIRDKSRSPTPVSREKSEERSKTPPRTKRYRSKSRSKSRSPPPPPKHHKHNGRKSPRRRRRSRSRSPSPPPSRVRSPTPPSFGGFARIQEDRLDESNKGHQMLKKMGWGGAGLGSNEQGIEAPISGGDVRDRVDQYKGVGVDLHDPFDTFRKNRGQAFITRMKARAEERAAERLDY